MKKDTRSYSLRETGKLTRKLQQQQAVGGGRWQLCVMASLNVHGGGIQSRDY